LNPPGAPFIHQRIQHMTQHPSITAPPTDPPDADDFTITCAGGGALLAGWLAAAGPPAPDHEVTED
jgi:hypothetical protein